MRSALTQATDARDMNEFFVMRKYRRQGVGRTAAHRLFDMFPGKWEVRQVAANVAAQAFWRRVIGEYTNGDYEERLVPSRRGNRPAQFFVSDGKARGT